ncbi:MAG: four helix bundle protein [Bacteroidota bacterium]
MNQQELEDRLINFAAVVIDMVDMLPASIAGKHLAGQLIRSGTSPALNYGEARGAESRKDFIHKNKVVLKELRETLICQKIIDHAHLIKGKDEFLAKAMNENNELVSIFVKMIKSLEGK